MGMVEGIVPDLEDPFLQTSSPFSLLSKTFKNSRKGIELDDHRAFNVQNIINSMELTDQIKLMDQAKEILYSNLELPSFEFAVQFQSQNEGVTSEKILDVPRRQRQGLHRKRARFSLIPTKSEPVRQADPRAILKDLKDPMEYFDALENIERAEKEIKRLRGETETEPIQPKTRRVRPGLNIGRKTTFNQIYQKFVNEKENLVRPLGEKENLKVPTSSQDSLDLLSEATEKSSATPEREAPVGEPPDFTPGKGSISEMEEKVNKSLDELLMTCRDLDENQTLNLLQKHLSIKPLVSEIPNLPDFDIVPNIDLKSQDKLRRPSRDFSSLQSMVGPNTNWKALIENRMDRMSVERSRLPHTPANPHTSPHSLVFALRGSNSPLHSESDLISLPFNSDVSSPKQSLAVDGMDNEILSPPNAHEMETRSSIRNGDPSLKISENRSSNFSSLQSMVGPNTNWKALIEDRMDRMSVERSRLPHTPANPHTSPHSLVSALRGSNSLLHSESDLISLPFNSDVSSPKHSLAVDGMDNEILSPPNAHEMETRSSIRNGDPSLKISENRSSNKLLSSTEGAHDEALSLPIDVNKIDIVRNSGSTSDHSPPKHEKSASCNREYQTSTIEGYMNSSVNDRLLQREDLSHPVNMLMDDDSNRSDEERNVNGLEGSLDGKVNDKLPEGSVSQEPGQCIEGLTMGTERDTGSDLDEPSHTSDTCPPQNENLETWNLLPEQNNEDIQVPSTVLSGEGLKSKAPPRQKQKRAHRFSLAGAGTKWENGLRRSKRESTRPLQFWKGERLLYGRVHDSLATVIGVKYATASENENYGERRFTVKCLVSNEYAELVEEAARH